MKDTFIKSIYAGILIGIGAIVSLSIDNKIIGSFLFSFGLLTIVSQKFNLYTGKVGFAKTKNDFINLLIIIGGNLIGTYLTSFLYRCTNINYEKIDELCNKKLNNGILQTFILSMFCGVLMYLAIDTYNKTQNILFISLPVMIFILSGFEHSIANMFYFFSSNIKNLESFLFIILNLVGNGVGALLFAKLKRG